mgnify:CR=1 FL=1
MAIYYTEAEAKAEAKAEAEASKDKRYDFVATVTTKSNVWGNVDAASKEEAKELIEGGNWNEIIDEETHPGEEEVWVDEADIEYHEE